MTASYPARMPTDLSSAAPADPSGPSRPLAVLLLAALLLPPLAGPPPVPVTIDGRTTVLRTHAATVADVLAAAGLALAPDDLVLPEPGLPATAGASGVVVETAVDATVLINGRERIAVRTTDATVDGVLAAAGLTSGERLRADTGRDPAAPVADGEVLAASLPMPVRAVVEGVTLVGWSPADTPAGVLGDLGVELRDHHVITPAPDAPMRPGTEIAVRRVEVLEVEERVAVPRPVSRVETPDLYVGVVRVADEGRDGEELVRLRVTREDGVEVAREELSRERVTPAVPRVERIGTREVRRPDVWDDLARCEAGGRWDAVRTIRGVPTFAGGLQFHPRTWAAYRPAGFPEAASQASREQQIEVAERVLAAQGWGAWPACARRLGLR